jgi:hypothetical protein
VFAGGHAINNCQSAYLSDLPPFPLPLFPNSHVGFHLCYNASCSLCSLKLSSCQESPCVTPR